MKKFYTLRNDLVFKNVFLKEINKLKWLLNGIIKIIGLNNDIEIYEISNCELYKDRIYIKNKTVDSIIITNYAYINIELNNTFNDDKKIRNFCYHTSYLNQLVHINDDYASIDKPVIQINLNSSTNKNNNIINKYAINDSISFDEYLDIFYIFNINIDTMLDKWYNELNQDLEYFNKYKYLLIIGMNEQKLKELEVEDDMIKEIKEDVITLNKSPKFYQVMTDEEDNRRMMNTMFKEGEAVGFQKGESMGKTLGIEETNRNNAKRMKCENIPINIIKKITGLDTNTIMNL